jgi:hypothetical protein
MQLDKLQKTLIRKIALVSCYTFCYCSIYRLRLKTYDALATLYANFNQYNFDPWVERFRTNPLHF